MSQQLVISVVIIVHYLYHQSYVYCKHISGNHFHDESITFILNVRRLRCAICQEIITKSTLKPVRINPNNRWKFTKIQIQMVLRGIIATTQNSQLKMKVSSWMNSFEVFWPWHSRVFVPSNQVSFWTPVIKKSKVDFGNRLNAFLCLARTDFPQMSIKLEMRWSNPLLSTTSNLFTVEQAQQRK